MTNAAHAQQPVYTAARRDPVDGETDFHEPTDAAGAARSARNILQWMSYLPPDCIERMIAMGWDRTT